MKKEEKVFQKKTENPASLTTTRRSTNKEGGGGNPKAKKICHQRRSYLQVNINIWPHCGKGGESKSKED